MISIVSNAFENPERNIGSLHIASRCARRIKTGTLRGVNNSNESPV
jgi:hypothetical protein